MHPDNNDKTWLDEMLTQQKIQQPPDDGFSDRVLSSLPTERLQHWQRVLMVVMFTMFGGLLGLVLLPGGVFLIALVKFSAMACAAAPLAWLLAAGLVLLGTAPIVYSLNEGG